MIFQMYRSQRIHQILCKQEDNQANVRIWLHKLTGSHRTAGSETTATCLSCVTYYLLKNPDVCRKLQEEVRSAFKSYDEITANRTSPMKYLNAVCLEGMRIYPPLPFALPRVVPEGGDTVDGHPLPAGVSPAALGFSKTELLILSDHCFDKSSCSQFVLREL